jgi:Cdc6-like AAA superfamily ATPase
MKSIENIVNDSLANNTFISLARSEDSVRAMESQIKIMKGLIKELKKSVKQKNASFTDIYNQTSELEDMAYHLTLDSMEIYQYIKGIELIAILKDDIQKEQKQ